MSKLKSVVQIEDSIRHLKSIDYEFRCIYLDPPYDLGRTFKYSAVLDGPEFKDSWEGDEYAVWLDQLIAECKRVLAKDGTLFLHMSSGQSLIPEMVLNKHFPKVEKIYWQKAHGKNTVKNKLGAVVDIVFMASGKKRKFNLLYTPLDAYYLENSYKNKDERGLYALGAIKHDKTRASSHMYDVTEPATGRVYKAREVAPYGWRMPEEEMLAMIKQGRIHFSGKKGATLYKKLYKDEAKGVPLSDLWTDIHYITRTDQDRRYYPTQKPYKLLRRIVALSSDPGDWVLDPCAGSGTTGAAALSLGRHAYMIDVNPESEPIIKERLKKAEEEGVVPIEADTAHEQASKKTKKAKKKSKKDAKPKPQPGQTTLTGLTSMSANSSSNPPKENNKDETSDKSDDKKKPMDKPKLKTRKVSERLGRNNTAEQERIYKHIETVVYEAEQKRDKPRLKKNDKGEVCAQCTFGKKKGSASGVKHEGDEWIPIRNFNQRCVTIKEDESIELDSKKAPIGLQNNCIACEKARRRWRSEGAKKRYAEIVEKEEKKVGRKLTEDEKKAAADAWADEQYGPTKRCSRGEDCVDADGPDLPWSMFGLSLGHDPKMIHHNYCMKCRNATSTEGDRWAKYNFDGHHIPVKDDSTICEQEGCDITENLENDHCVELNFGGSDKEANQQWLHKNHHDEKKGTIGPNIKSVHDVTKDMVSERFHPVLDKAKEENWSLDKLVSQLKIAMEKFLRWKVSLTDDDLKAFFTSQNARNNTQHDVERAVHKFRKWCSNSPHRWDPEHKDYAKIVSGLEVEIEFSIDGS